MSILINDGRIALRIVFHSMLTILCLVQVAAAGDPPFDREIQHSGTPSLPSRILLRDIDATDSSHDFGHSLPLNTDKSSRHVLSTARLPSQAAQDNFLLDSVPGDGSSGSTGTDSPDAVFSSRPKRSMRPKFNFGGEWLAEASNVELKSFDAGLKLPTYPVFGPPPPIINIGVSYTDLAAPRAMALPGELFDYSFGAAWMRPINDRWMLRLMLNAGIATDGENTTSDMWQFRGGFFAMYRRNPQWSWMFGVLALGRNDLPVVPAAGAIWTPSPRLRLDLILPRPRISVLLNQQGDRQHWAYLGTGFSGGTWAYQRVGGLNDQLTYKDWRAVLGWELVPARSPGAAFGSGQRIGMEVGYVFSREFEFDSGLPDVEIGDTWMLQAKMSF